MARNCRSIVVAILLSALLMSISQKAYAVPPPFVSDRELAKSSLVVVAKWNGAPWKNNSKVKDNVVEEFEAATEIEVKRVVKGNVALGKHTILVEYAIGWSAEIPEVMSYTSTQAVGDANATEFNLWFLTEGRSLIDNKPHWKLETYRGVQPLVLESYFKALDDGTIVDQIPKLFRTGDETVQLRTLEVVAGGDFAWPYEPWRFVRPPAEDARPLKDKADLVRALIAETRNQDARRHAVAVYGLIVGESSVAYMRTRLIDEDPVVRAIAMGTLAAHKDLVSVKDWAKALKGLDDPSIACDLIKRLDSWGDPTVATALIEFLQNDGNAGQRGAEWNVPAILAKKSLLKITRHEFPFDVAKSRIAWEAASKIDDPDAQKTHLARTAPSDSKPWIAKLQNDQERFFIEITNRSQNQLTLAKKPTSIDAKASYGLLDIGTIRPFDGRTSRQFGTGTLSYFGINTIGELALDKTDFVSLEPGKSFRFELDTKDHEEFNAARTLTISLTYMSNGNKFGVNSWLGIIPVETSER